MDIATLTHHAQTRMQQRGIPRDVLDQLLTFGSEHHDHRGGTILIMDKAAWRRLRSACGERAGGRMDRARRAYAVVGRDGGVVTVGHRFKRLRNR